MGADILDVALRNESFSGDCIANPEVFRSGVAIIDRLILIYGKDIKDCKLDGPLSNIGGFDVCWTLNTKEA